MYRPFVELVEEHDRVALECRIVEQHAVSTPSVTTSTRVIADTRVSLRVRRPMVSPTCSRVLRPSEWPPLGRRPAGLQHEHPAFTDPWLLDERRWDARGLAGAGRRLHDDETLVVERSVKLGKRAVDGERHVGGFAQFSASSSAITVATASATDSGWLRITKWRAPSTVVR